MQAEADKQQTLQMVLAAEAACSGELLACLATEREALVNRDMPRVEATTAQKLQLSQQLEELERQRAALVTGLGFGPGGDDLRDCYSRLPQAEDCQRLWQLILDNLRACRHGNLTNGGILEASRQHVEQALAILRGQTDAPGLYSPDGDSNANLGQRVLGKV